MAQGFTCDRCGKNLLIDEEVRYVARMEFFAAYDPLEITADDMEKDRQEEIRSLLEKMESMTEQEAMDSVYKRMTFDLCPACHAAVLRNPLGR